MSCSLLCMVDGVGLETDYIYVYIYIYIYIYSITSNYGHSN
jgi:hypothetical protein